MRVAAGRCRGCGACLASCPVGALRLTSAGPATVDRDACVECGACRRSGVCGRDALRSERLRWPRTLRALFSDPRLVHRGTRIPGRGTEEMKTNDVTGRLGEGAVGVTLEVGRPCLGASFADVERLTRACARFGARLEARNPLAALVVDPATGALDPAVLAERVLSVVIELQVPEGRLVGLLRAVAAASERLGTVVTVGVSQRAAARGSVPVAARLRAAGLRPSPRGKTNVGLGRRP